MFFFCFFFAVTLFLPFHFISGQLAALVTGRVGMYTLSSPSLLLAKKCFTKVDVVIYYSGAQLFLKFTFVYLRLVTFSFY